MDRVTADKFMLKRITQKYTDEEIDAFIAAKRHVTNNTGATKDSFGKNIGKDGFSPIYSRTLPIKSVPKGTLLFTYYAASVPPEDYSPEQKAKHSFSELIGSSVMPCTYNKDTDTFTVTYCKYNFMGNYYYPVPCAGFGILGYDTNTAVSCLTTRDAEVAYLKTGGSPDTAEVPTKMNMALATNFQWVDFDFKRVQRCDHIETTGKCDNGNNYDICLNPEFIRAKRLAGYQAIAFPDRICEISQGKQDGRDVFLMDMHTMGKRYQAWLENIVSHGNQESDIFLHNMNLLCLESDITYAYDKTFPAFSEYFLYTFGENDPVELMNSLPDDPIIIERRPVEKEGDIIVKLDVTVSAANIQQFLDTYIFPYTVTHPFNMFNSNGYGIHNVDNVPILLAEKPPLLKRNNNPTNNLIRNRGQQRNEYEYLVNHNIAEVIYNMRNTLVYDLTKNLILVIDEAVSERGKPMLRGYTTADFRQDTTPYPIGLYDIPLVDNNAAERALKVKVHHEMLSFINKKVYDKCFMHEYEIKDMLTGEIYKVPIGPFFNAFTNGFANPIALCNQITIDFINSLIYTSGSTMEETLLKDGIKINAQIMAHFFIKYLTFQKIVLTISSIPGFPKSQFLTEMTGANMLHYSTLPVYLNNVLTSQQEFSKYFIVKYPVAQPNSNIPKMNIFYSTPLYRGKWRWSYADLLFTDGPSVLPRARRVGLLAAPVEGNLTTSASIPAGAGLHSTNVGLPIPLSTLPNALVSTNAPTGFRPIHSNASRAFINQLLRGSNPTADKGANRPPNKGGSRYKTRRNNRIKMTKINIRNIRKNTRRNTRNMRKIINRNLVDDLVKPTIVTFSNSEKDIMYLQAINPGAVIAHNEMVKNGLINGFFIKFSGKPLQYKTAN